MRNITLPKDLTKKEKLIMMEALWEDLSKEDLQVDSPEWHELSLRETEKLVQSGTETIHDWIEAKKKLRKRCK